MSNKNRNLRKYKTNLKNETYNLQSNNLSNSVKFWSFILLLMHYFLYSSLCFSLHSDFCTDSQLCGLFATHSRLCSRTFCLAQTSQMGGLFQQSAPICQLVFYRHSSVGSVPQKLCVGSWCAKRHWLSNGEKKMMTAMKNNICM